MTQYPYRGFTARLGKREVNVHFVKDGVVYYGLYDDDAADVAPERCIGAYRLPVQDFMAQLDKEIKNGAVTFTRYETSEQ